MKKHFFRREDGKIRVWRIILLVLAVLLLAAGIFGYLVLAHPALFFRGASAEAVKTEVSVTGETVQPMVEIPEEEETEIEAEPEETQEETAQSANIVNVLLMGIDAYENGGTTSGTEPHTDVVILCAINFDTDTVDLISIPRDTFTIVNGVRGVYRLNSVFNVGGGLKDPDAAFEGMCRLIEQWMGVSIPYYYAVDFQAVIDAVDAIGGVDYNVDISTTTLSKGQQHLNGTQVLGYLRYRAHTLEGDRARTARQRSMLIAIFNQLKQANMIESLPDLINSASSGIYTNTTLAQTAALAGYAASASELTINSRIVDGDREARYDWVYSFADQENRLEIIREVYGFEAEPVRYSSMRYEDWMWHGGFTGLKYILQCVKLLEWTEENCSSDSFTPEQKAAYIACYGSYSKLQAAFNAVDEWYLSMYLSDGNFTDEEQAELDSLMEMLTAAEKQAKSDNSTLLNAVSCPLTLRYSVSKGWYNDSDINEVRVDFN